MVHVWLSLYIQMGNAERTTPDLRVVVKTHIGHRHSTVASMQLKNKSLEENRRNEHPLSPYSNQGFELDVLLTSHYFHYEWNLNSICSLIQKNLITWNNFPILSPLEGGPGVGIQVQSPTFSIICTNCSLQDLYMCVRSNTFPRMSKLLLYNLSK